MPDYLVDPQRNLYVRTDFQDVACSDGGDVEQREFESPDDLTSGDQALGFDRAGPRVGSPVRAWLQQLFWKPSVSLFSCLDHEN